MKLTIDANETNCMTTNELIAKIAVKQFWTVGEKVEGSCGTFYVTLVDGRIATYDVVGDELELDDGTSVGIFDMSCVDWYCGQSLLEFLDCSTAIWGEDEEGEYFLYTEE